MTSLQQGNGVGWERDEAYLSLLGTPASPEVRVWIGWMDACVE